jgi:hypothetical protein
MIVHFTEHDMRLEGKELPKSALYVRLNSGQTVYNEGDILIQSNRFGISSLFILSRRSIRAHLNGLWNILQFAASRMRTLSLRIARLNSIDARRLVGRKIAFLFSASFLILLAFNMQSPTSPLFAVESGASLIQIGMIVSVGFLVRFLSRVPSAPE